MDLTSLKKSRATRHTHIDRLIDEIDQSIANNVFADVEAGLTKLEVKECTLLEVYSKLEALTPTDEVEDEINTDEAFHDSILDAKIRANRYLKQATAVITAGQNPAPAAATARTVAKLPKLQIPKFDGSLLDYERFWSQFNSGIHSNPSLSKVDKFNYLLSLLTEKARLSIKGFSITDANYDAAILLIQEKYGKAELLVDEHIKQLWNSRHVTQIGNGQELRMLYEEFQSHIQSLEALGKNTATMGTLLCHILRKSLPKQLLIEWNRKTLGATNDDLTQLLNFVKQELEGVEAACRVIADSVKEQSIKKESSSSNNRTTSSLVTTGNGGSQSKQSSSSKFERGPFCIFCREDTHTSTACTVYTTNKARKENLMRAGRCFKCLQLYHMASSCDQRISCRVCKKTNHHSLLCAQRESFQTAPHTTRSAQATKPRNNEYSTSRNNESTASRKNESTTAVITENTDEQQALIASSSSHSQGSKKVSILQTMRVWIRNGSVAQPATILVDGGSEKSFIVASTVEKMGLKSQGQETTTIRSFGGHKTQQQTALINFTIEGRNGIQLNMTAWQVPEICQGVKLWESALIERYLQDKRIYTWNQKMGPGEVVSVDILIGADYYWQVMSGHMKRLSSTLMATESIFGWMLQGCTEMHTPIHSTVTMLTIQDNTHTTIQQHLSQLWELDKSGIMAAEDKSQATLQDIEVLHYFESTTTYQEERYQVRIPWKSNKTELTSNFSIAKERLRRMLWKLQKDPTLYERYKNGIFEYLNNGHAEEVSLEHAHLPLYYMPHHAIVREDRKTTKIRIVFDGSSCQAGHESLNTCQETGPSLNPPIFNLLLRFRWEAVAMTSDLEKAFLQISIHPDDRDAIRFLWTDKPWGKNEEPQLKVFRMSRVLFGMKSSPFLLAATIRLHVRTHTDSDPNLSKYIADRIYVDDLLSGAKDTQTAYALFKRIHQLFLKGSMKLTKWTTNDSDLRSLWIQEGIASATEPIELLKVLGLIWNPATDDFSLKFTTILESAKEDSNTKRSMLKILATLFDPLGFLSPTTIIVKKLLQDLWKLKIDWDDTIPSHLLETWEAWKKNLEFLPKLQVPRWLQASDSTSIQLHVFCDAGPRAYATVAYIRFLDSAGNWNTQLITAKARLAPIQLMSIPRLELMACLIGSRLALSITQTYDHTVWKVYLWSDSKVALQWISDIPSRWKLFVGRRVQEIQEICTTNSTWLYCPTKNNIADILTRGQELPKLLNNQEWWMGPHWLRLPQEVWHFDISDITSQEIADIMQEEIIKEASVNLNITSQPLIPEKQYSTWKKFMRITAWIMRFVNNCRQGKRNSSSFLTYKELQAAELYWFKMIQSDQFSKELRALKKEEELDKHSALLQFQPFIDKNNLIRLGGRLNFADLTENQQHPIFLRGGGMVDLLIQDRHFKTLHGSTQITLAKLRNDVWILRGRQAVRKAIHGCMGCRRWNAKPANEVEAPLPEARVTQSEPFHTTGIDFAGPLEIRDGGKIVKAYICLFTCAVTRAVHLELAASQGLNHFLLAFRRFFARRGGCKLVYSDNGASFHQMDRLLRESYGHLYNTQTQELATQFGIEWRFIAPRASWWGGFYERMVQSVKFHLRRSLGNALLSAEELATLLTEIEAVLNNRPLTSLSEDSADLDYLTPSHFLLGKSTGNLCDSLEFINEPPTKQQLMRRWKYRKQLMTRFWKSWKHDYLLQLKTAHTVKSAALNQEPLKINDVVLIMDDKLPRGQWKIANIVELTKGRDNKIRSVMLQTPNKNLIRRAVQSVCPLEIAKVELLKEVTYVTRRPVKK